MKEECLLLPKDRFQAVAFLNLAMEIAEKFGVKATIRCDGDHAGPRCGDPDCWNDDPVELFLEDVRAELRRAREKFPGDRITLIALAEEFGELSKALLDETANRVYKEAVQTAVMAARVAIDGDSSVDDWREVRGLGDHRNGREMSYAQPKPPEAIPLQKYQVGEHIIPKRSADSPHATVWKIDEAYRRAGEWRYHCTAPGFGSIEVYEMDIVVTDQPVSIFGKLKNR